MSLCLQKNICLPQSLCYSVFKKTSVSLCHYVIMSSKKHLFLSVTLLFCLQKKHPSPFVIMSFCLQKNICLPLSLCYSVFKRTSVSLSVTMLFCLQKNICLPLSLCHYVFKKASVSLRHSVILSSKKTSVSLCHYVILFSKKTSVSLSHSVILSENAPVGDGSGPSCCCCYFFSFCLISIFHKQCYVLPHYLSSIYSF